MKFNMKYGLIVISKKEMASGIHNIIHFAGFEEPPSESDKAHIFDEVLNDPMFSEIPKLYDKSDLMIIDADESTVKEFVEMVENDNIENMDEDVTIN